MWWFADLVSHPKCTVSPWHNLEQASGSGRDLEGSRDPGFDPNTVRDSGKDKISGRDSGFETLTHQCNYKREYSELTRSNLNKLSCRSQQESSFIASQSSVGLWLTFRRERCISLSNISCVYHIKLYGEGILLSTPAFQLLWKCLNTKKQSKNCEL